MCEERQRLSVEEVVDSRGNIKLLNDEDNMVPNQQEQVQNSTVEQIVAVPVPRVQPRSFTARVKAMTSRKSDEDDQEARDQCQTEEVQ